MEGRKKQDQEGQTTPPRDDRGADGEDKPRRWRRPSRNQAFWLFFVLVMIFTVKFLGSKPSDPQLVSYKEYRQYLDQDRIAAAVIVGEREFEGVLHDGTRFVVNLGPIDGETKREWEERGVDFRFEEEPFRWKNFLFSFLPWAAVYRLLGIHVAADAGRRARAVFLRQKSGQAPDGRQAQGDLCRCGRSRRGQEGVGGDH